MKTSVKKLIPITATLAWLTMAGQSFGDTFEVEQGFGDVRVGQNCDYSAVGYHTWSALPSAPCYYLNCPWINYVTGHAYCVADIDSDYAVGTYYIGHFDTSPTDWYVNIYN